MRGQESKQRAYAERYTIPVIGTPQRRAQRDTREQGRIAGFARFRAVNVSHFLKGYPTFPSQAAPNTKTLGEQSSSSSAMEPASYNSERKGGSDQGPQWIFGADRFTDEDNRRIQEVGCARWFCNRLVNSSCCCWGVPA